MRPQAPRRMVILTEGHFGPHSGKTAFGVLRYGRDEVVAVLDSTLAGRTTAEWIPGSDVPHATVNSASARTPRRADAYLLMKTSFSGLRHAPGP